MKFLIHDNVVEVHFDPDRMAGQGRALVKYMCSEKFEMDFEAWLQKAREKLATEVAENERECKLHGTITPSNKPCMLQVRL